MALIACRECKKKVSAEAKICTNCGIEKPFAFSDKFFDEQGKLRDLTAAECSKLTSAEKKAYKTVGGKLKLTLFMKIMQGILFLVILFIVIQVKNSNPESESDKMARIQKEEAQAEMFAISVEVGTVCEKSIIKQLKDSSSAEFNDYPKLTQDAKTGLWWQAGTVTAKNSFNANVTNKYICKVKYENEKATLIASEIVR